MKKYFFYIAVIFILILTGCGASGTWKDDTQNWNRAFNSQKPSDVTIIHSKYWRSSHFTMEFQYFFEIENNSQLKKQLFTANKLKLIEGKEADVAFKKFFVEKPKWFIPETIEEYEFYTYIDQESGHSGNFRVFIHKKTGELFLTDYQV